MESPLFFPIDSFWSFYVAFTVAVLAILSVDLGVFHRRAHEVRYKEAVAWTVFWICLALGFNYWLYHYVLSRALLHPELAVQWGGPQQVASQLSLEFLTGYLVEKALSVDNIFIFVVIFRFFAIPVKYQHRILFYGILGALVFRALFIALGAVLMKYQIVVEIFGVFLIYTGVKLVVAEEKPLEPEKNPGIRILKKIFPITTKIENQRFVERLGGKLHATPLLVTLVFVELTDILFAVDSVPAIYGITREPFIVFTSNVFAILGLRSLYFLLSGAMHRFHLLKYGLGAVLVFVGLKMTCLSFFFEGEFPIGWSLGIIAGLIASAIVASLIAEKRNPAL